MKILNKKQARKILEQIEQQWDCKLAWLDTHYLVMNERNKIYLVNREVEQLDIHSLKINTIGLYIADSTKNIRLSIEGAQIVGKTAKKNVLQLSIEQAKAWLQGEDISYPGNKGFVIIKNGEDILGCGNLKDGVLLNYVPKTRRVPAHA